MGWQDDPIVEKAPAWEADAMVASLNRKPIVLAANVRPPKALRASDNPNSAGYFPIGRIFTVGDRARFRVSDALSGVATKEFTHRVTRIDADNDRVEINDGAVIFDLMGNIRKSSTSTFAVVPQFAPAELYVGKRWRALYQTEGSTNERRASYEFQIIRRERVALPAGEFFAFLADGFGRIEYRNQNDSVPMTVEERYWYLPGINFHVRFERIARSQRGYITNAVRHELVALRQATSGVTLTVD
jgi:hypothetical protein